MRPEVGPPRETSGEVLRKKATADAVGQVFELGEKSRLAQELSGPVRPIWMKPTICCEPSRGMSGDAEPLFGDEIAADRCSHLDHRVGRKSECGTVKPTCIPLGERERVAPPEQRLGRAVLYGGIDQGECRSENRLRSIAAFVLDQTG